MTVFITWPFKATGGTVGRTMPDRLADVINVKDYGATGDGTTNDSTAIQSAFDAAFGSSAAPHGANSSANKPVFFPNGTYNLGGSGLTLTDVSGGHIYGGSMGATRITGTSSALLRINGMADTLVENFNIANSGKSSSNGTICVDLDWDGTSTSVGLSNNHFFKCLLESANYGMRVSKSGNGGSAVLLSQVAVTNNYFGLTIDSSAASVTLIGGGPSESNIGTQVTKGNFFTIGAGGAGSAQTDIQLDSGGQVTVIGTRSESINHVSISNGNYLGMAVDLNGSFQGYAANLTSTQASATFINCALGTPGSSNSYITGSAGYVYLRGTTFNNSPPIFLSSFSGQVKECLGPTFTFSQLPSSNNAAEGLQINLTDGNSTTWGAAVTGSSNKHVLVRWNSTGWTVVGN